MGGENFGEGGAFFEGEDGNTLGRAGGFFVDIFGIEDEDFLV